MFFTTDVLEHLSADGCTALVLAAKNGSTNVLEYLLRKGANATASDYEGNNSLHWATENGHLEAMRVLLRVIPIDSRNKKEETPVLYAANKTSYFWSKEKSIKFLLDNGADPMAVDEIGNTALHKAALHGNKILIKLFKGRVPVESLNARLETPFALACYFDENIKNEEYRVKNMLLSNEN
jgi:uncharacterized protein